MIMTLIYYINIELTLIYHIGHYYGMSVVENEVFYDITLFKIAIFIYHSGMEQDYYCGIWCAYNLPFVYGVIQKKMATVVPINNNCWKCVYSSGTLKKNSSQN